MKEEKSRRSSSCPMTQKGDWDELEGKYSPCEKEKGSCFQEKKAGLRREKRGPARPIRPKHLHRLLVWNKNRNVTK